MKKKVEEKIVNFVDIKGTVVVVDVVISSIYEIKNLSNGSLIIERITLIFVIEVSFVNYLFVFMMFNLFVLIVE